MTAVPMALDRAPDPGEGDGFATRLSVELASSRGRLLFASLATAVATAVITAAGSSHRVPPLPPPPPAEGVTATSVPPPPPGDPGAWMMLARSAAATCPGLAPEVLFSIAEVETGLGSSTAVSRAGAEGPMQFLPPTWAAYGTDADGDGRADVTNAVDAVHGAARFLCANGGADPARLGSAVWNYNHSNEYVRRVLSLAAPRGPMNEDS